MMRLRAGFTMIELMVAIVIIAILAAITLSIGSAVLESADRRKTQDILSLLDAAMTEYEQHVGRPMSYGQGDGEGRLPLQAYQDMPLNGVSSYDIRVENVVTNIEDADPGNHDHPPQLPRVGFLEDYSVDPGSFDSWETAVSRRLGQHLMVEVLERLRSVESCKKILARIDSSHWAVDPTFELTPQFLVDAWGRPIIPVFAGRDWYTKATDASGLNDVEDSDPTVTNTPRRDMDGTIRTFEERAFGPARGERIYFMSTGPDGRYGWIGFTKPMDATFAADPDDVRYGRTEDNLYSYEVRQW